MFEQCESGRHKSNWHSDRSASIFRSEMDDALQSVDDAPRTDDALVTLEVANGETVTVHWSELREWGIFREALSDSDGAEDTDPTGLGPLDCSKSTLEFCLRYYRELRSHAPTDLSETSRALQSWECDLFRSELDSSDALVNVVQAAMYLCCDVLYNALVQWVAQTITQISRSDTPQQTKERMIADFIGVTIVDDDGLDTLFGQIPIDVEDVEMAPRAQSADT